MPDLTPTQARIYRVLQDGLPHSKQEIMRKCMDEYAEENCLLQHIHKLKANLKPHGEGLLQENGTYRLVRFISR